MSDVARVAGVSVTTVSYVLSGKRAVAESTSQAVHRAVDELGFTLNTAARTLRTGRSNLVALVVPDIANPFYAQLAAGLEERLRGPGYHVVICNTQARRPLELAFLADVVEQRFAGVVITPFRLKAADFEPVRAAGIPVVVSADHWLDGLDQVVPDAVAAVRAAVEHAVASGRLRIGMIAGPRDAQGGDPRLDLLRVQAAEAGYAVPEEFVVRGEHTREAGDAGFTRLMSRPVHPDVIFCVNDVTAVGALDAAERLGVQVPEDVALVGHDDVVFASLVRPRLTTLRYPPLDVGHAAAALLTERSEGRVHSRTHRIPVTFVQRSTF